MLGSVSIFWNGLCTVLKINDTNAQDHQDSKTGTSVCQHDKDFQTLLQSGLENGQGEKDDMGKDCAFETALNLVIWLF